MNTYIRWISALGLTALLMLSSYMLATGFFQR
jgi:hypothetical protein